MSLEELRRRESAEVTREIMRIIEMAEERNR